MALARPGLGKFEDEVRSTSALLALKEPTLDLRVAKGRGDRGYNKVRVSVVSHGTPLVGARITGTVDNNNTGVPFSYSAPFKYRWEASFDLGTKSSKCNTASGRHIFENKKYG
jgi:hypothetical protein